jgi:hypothetical protein
MKKQISDYYEEAKKIDKDDWPFRKMPPEPTEVFSEDPAIVGDYYFKLREYENARDHNASLLHERDQPKRKQYTTCDEQLKMRAGFKCTEEELLIQRDNGNLKKRSYNVECSLFALKTLFGNDYDGELIPILNKIDADNIENAICILSSNLYIRKNVFYRVLRNHPDNAKIDNKFIHEVYLLFTNGDGLVKFGDTRMSDGSPVIPNNSWLTISGNEVRIIRTKDKGVN